MPGAQDEKKVLVVVVPVPVYKAREEKADHIDGDAQPQSEAIPGMLGDISARLEAIQSIFLRLLKLWEIAKKYKKLSLILLVFTALYLTAIYCGFCLPARTIAVLYKDIEDKNYHAAWEALYPPYREQRWKDEGNFKDGFKTTVDYSDMSISYTGHVWNPIDLYNALVRGDLKFEVSFTVRDRFRQSDLQRDENQQLLMLLHAMYPTEYDQLRDGTLKDPTGNPNPALEMTRSFKKTFELRRRSGWKISHIDTFEETLIRHLHN